MKDFVIKKYFSSDTLPKSALKTIFCPSDTRLTVCKFSYRPLFFIKFIFS